MVFDVVVIGGNFAGLSAALQLARARKRVLTVDSGLPRNRFSSTSHGFFGQDGKVPLTIQQEAAAQLSAYGSAEQWSGEVIEVLADPDGFMTTFADGRMERARRLILATGVKDELPAIPGLEERWGTTVLHCPYCQGYEVRDRRLGVVADHVRGGRQAALISEWGPTTLLTQSLFEPDAEELRLLLSRGVAIERSPIVEVVGVGAALQGVRLADDRVLEIDALFIASRTRMASPLAEQLGCAFLEGSKGPFIRTDGWGRTTIPGVYAAGDAASPRHSIALACASGALAGVSAHQSLVGHLA